MEKIKTNTAPVPDADRFLDTAYALWRTATSYIDPKHLRVTPMRRRRVAGVVRVDKDGRAEPGWVGFRPAVSGESQQVGVVTLDKGEVLESMRRFPDSRFGVVEALGRSTLLFADYPGHALLDLAPSPGKPDVSFGIRGADQGALILVAPALVAPDKSVYLLPDAIVDQRLMMLEGLPAQVRVL